MEMHQVLIEHGDLLYNDSMHVAGICLGKSQARTHVQVALACQKFMTRVQHRLRLTMQHVHRHSGILGNECADHAAAFGTLGSPLATMSLRVGLDTTLTLLCVF